MRVALVTPYLPWPADNGGKLRSYHLLKGLAQVAEIDLFTVCYGPTPTAGPLEQICRSVAILAMQPVPPRRQFWDACFHPTPSSVRHFQSAAALKAIRSRLGPSIDLLVCDEICMTPYVDGLATHQETPRLVVRHKVDHLHYRETAEARPMSLRKLLDTLESKRLQAFERAAMPLVQAAVVCSPEDGEIVAQQARGLEIRVIVNGADTDYFMPERQPDAAPTILLLGTMDYYPNIDAVKQFFLTMHPALRAALPDLRVLVVGHSPPPELAAFGKLPGVTVTGSVPDVRPYMARSWIMAVPLRLGGGTRLKIVEAMAAGLPVISTTVGAQGLDAVDGRQILLADTPAHFVDRTLRLLGDAALRQTLTDGALDLARRRYSWQSLGRQYAEFCVEIAGLRTAFRSKEITSRPADVEHVHRSVSRTQISDR